MLYTFKMRKISLLTIILICLLVPIFFVNQQKIKFKYNFFIKPVKQRNKYPGSFLSTDFEKKPSPNITYCNYNYGVPRSLLFSHEELTYAPELKLNSPYRILYDVIESRLSDNIPQVTYATHVTADFVNYIAEVVRYWDGYVSVAAFVSTSSDLTSIFDQISLLCLCLPEMSRVSLHLVFHKSQSTVFNQALNLSLPIATCVPKDFSKVSPVNKTEYNEMYPINVCRNVARIGSQTHLVMVSDVQLLPSYNLAAGFVKVLQEWRRLSSGKNTVFVVPVFEIEADVEEVPRTKTKLMEFVRDEKAVYFHRLICMHCQKFPGLENWLETKPGDGVVKPLLIARREVPYNRWEPVYIGTKFEPYYNEVLSWDGLQDKMLQMLEMCLLGYKFVILDGAFLVHWPGIKKSKNKHRSEWRKPFETENARQYSNILKKLSSKYKVNPHCKLQ